MALKDYSLQLIELVEKNIDENAGNDGAINVAGITLYAGHILKTCSPFDFEQRIDDFIETETIRFTEETSIESGNILYVGVEYQKTVEEWVREYLNKGKGVDELIEDAEIDKQEPDQRTDILTEVHCGEYWRRFEVLPPASEDSCNVGGHYFKIFECVEQLEWETLTSYGIEFDYYDGAYSSEYFFLDAKPHLKAVEIAAIFLQEHGYYNEKNLVIAERKN